MGVIDGMVSSFRFCAGVALAVVAVGGCDVDPTDGLPESFEEAVKIEDVLLLEEPENEFVVSPNLRPDPDGGWLYWDRGADEARLYAEHGGLRNVVGSQGDGPGEYQGVRALVRLGDGRLATVDDAGRVSVWGRSGEELLKDFETGLSPVVGAMRADGSRVIVSTAPRIVDENGTLAPWLHLVDLERENTIASGFAPVLDPSWSTALATVESPVPRRFGDSVYVALPVTDTVWVVDLDLRTGGPIPHALRSDRIRENSPPVTAAEGRAEFRAWTQTAWFLGDVLRLPDGRWLGNTWTFGESGMHGGVFLTDNRGELLWEFPSQLRLLTVDEQGRVYLWDRNGMRPNEVQVVTIR